MGKQKNMAASGDLHAAQIFTVKRMNRKALKGAPYNPRSIDPVARKKLLGKLKTLGLVEPLVFNQRTGHLVSGHQRLGILDDLAQGVDDYTLDVSVIDVTAKQEKELNLFLNNPTAQGMFDPSKLIELLKEGISLPETGFDIMDLKLSLGDDEVAKLFPDDPDMHATKNQSSGVQNDIAELQKIQEIKQRRREYKDAQRQEDDAEFYAVVVFQNRDEVDAFLRFLKVDGRYVDGHMLAGVLGVELPKALPPAEETTAPAQIEATTGAPQTKQKRGAAK